MKKIGIVADNYKVERFKKKLTEGGFTNIECSPITLAGNDQYTSIGVFVEEKDFQEAVKKITKICQLVELHFKRSN